MPCADVVSSTDHLGFVTLTMPDALSGLFGRTHSFFLIFFGLFIRLDYGGTLFFCRPIRQQSRLPSPRKVFDNGNRAHQGEDKGQKKLQRKPETRGPRVTPLIPVSANEKYPLLALLPRPLHHWLSLHLLGQIRLLHFRTVTAVF